MEQRFMFLDLAYFHNILENKISTMLPEYIKLVPEEEVLPADVAKVLPRLRSTHRDPLYFVCDVNPRINAFKQNFFYRAHALWNNLPLSVRLIQDTLQFQDKFKAHLESSVLRNSGIEPD